MADVRGLLVLGAAAAMLAVAPAGAHGKPIGGGRDAAKQASFAEAFARPPTSVRPLTYWWLPPLDAMTSEGMESDIDAVARAGIGGVLPYRRDFAMPADERHRVLLVTALRAAKRRGITLDLSLAETATAPSITADSAAAQQELVFGRAVLAAGEAFDGAPPPPPTRPTQRRSLVAVVAAHCTTSCESARPVLLDRDSLVDLTASASDGKLEWTAPSGDGEWILLSFWSRNAPALPSSADPTADLGQYADHLSADGAQAITDYLDEHVLTPEVKALLADAGGVLHEDSLHLGGFHLWSRDFLSEFRQRRGYSLRKYLAVSVIANVNDFSSAGRIPCCGPHTDSAADYDFAGDAGERIRNDYYQTLSELWQEQYVATLQRWAKRRGLAFRGEVAYGQTLSTATAARVDVPMTESFQLGDTLDGYRSMAGAVHMGGRGVFASECCVSVTRYRQDNYSTTWKRMLSVIHNNFAAGVNQIVLHGVTYPDAPGATWPGFSNFTNPTRPGHGEEFGPRMPYWHHMPDLTDFLAREQLVLREGNPRVDVAIYRQSYWDYGFPLEDLLAPHPGRWCEEPPSRCDRFFNDKTLERTGYTYEFVGPSLFDLRGAGVRHRRLTGMSSAGPAYKALVLNMGQRNAVNGMPSRTARQILGYARNGLPIVVVGEPPKSTGFFGDAANDAKVRWTISRLLEQPTVRRVATEAEVVKALEDLGVDPAAQPAQQSNLLSFRRVDGDTNYYFLWNQDRVNKSTGEPEPKPQGFDQKVSFEGTGVPFALDAWTGEITPIASYERHGDHSTVRVRLEPGESTIIAIGPKSWQRSALGHGRPEKAPVHAISITADEVVFGAHDKLRVRATRPGTYTTRLSDGREVQSTIGRLPSPETLSDWHLSVEDWRPGSTPTETAKIPQQVDLDSLRAWPEIPGLQDASGIGRYATQVELGPGWSAADGAQLELGPLFDSARLEVNGKSIGYVDPNNPVIHISRHLHLGTNGIEVEVATTLRNRVRTLLPGFANVERQPYGLVGPVRLVPYGEEALMPIVERHGPRPRSRPGRAVKTTVPAAGREPSHLGPGDAGVEQQPYPASLLGDQQQTDTAAAVRRLSSANAAIASGKRLP